MNRQGLRTAELGQKIAAFVRQHLGAADFLFFYDHGDAAKSPDDVAAIKGFVANGDDAIVANLNRLADIDMMLADRTGAVRLLIELEERATSPKKLLGDVLAVMMCDKCAVGRDGNQQYFKVKPDTTLIIAGILPDSGDRLQRITDVIQPRIRTLRGLDGCLDPKNVELIFDVNLEHPLEMVMERVRRYADPR